MDKRASRMELCLEGAGQKQMTQSDGATDSRWRDKMKNKQESLVSQQLLSQLIPKSS